MSTPDAQRTGGRLRDEQKLLTRKLLLEAARDVFSSQGYSGTKVDDIARAAGTRRSTLYRYFGGKHDLLKQLLDEFYPSVLESFRRLDDALGRGTADALRSWLDEHLSVFEANRGLVAAAVQATTTDSVRFDDPRAPLEDLNDWMPRYLARWGTARRAEARVRMQLLRLHLERLSLQWALNAPGADRDLALDALAAMWASSLNPASAQDLRSR